MLTIVIKRNEQYDEIKEEFIESKKQILQLEHSLVSLSKWESKWHKPFLSKEEKTHEETIDYIRCMTITQNVDSDMYNFISKAEMKKITNYIEDPMTATVISNTKKLYSKEIITAELIYYSMVALNIPFECQKWHLNRLLMLIEVCNIKNTPPKKMNKN